MNNIHAWEDHVELLSGETYYYWLEHLDLSGATTLHGPVSVTFDAPTAVTVSTMQAGALPAPAPSLLLVLLALTTAMLLTGWLVARRPQAGQ